MSDIDIHEVLTKVFKKPGFRNGQEDIIRSVIAGHDALVLLPTGHGKSLTYQLPAVVAGHGKTTIVISPLIALMSNQISGLAQLNINAVTLNGQTSVAQRRTIIQDLTSSRPSIQMLYVSPELCATGPFRKILATMYERHRSIVRFVIDEAHCCVEWGFDFRRDYMELSYLRKSCPKVPITALTATAPAGIQKGIIQILNLDNAGPRKVKVFTASVNRPNLHYEVRFFSDPDHCNDIIPDIEKFLTEYKARRIESKSTSTGAGIIYCRRKDTVELVAQELRERGFGAQAFHASISSADKDRVMKNWVDNVEGYEIVVATVAFGMGVDKPDVRFVIHVDLPGSIETYYQASGRAGRDGKGARCILYYSREDRARVLRLNKRDDETGTDMGLQFMIQYCERTNICRHLHLCSYFEQNVPRNPSKEWCLYACDYCKDLRALQRQATVLTEEEPYY